VPVISRVSADGVANDAVRDLWAGLKRHELWLKFAVHDIRQRFRRSMLGPLWVTLSTGIMIAALGVIFGALFEQPMQTFLPYVATGLIFWNFIVSTVSEGCLAFVAGEGFIRNVPMPLSAHFYRMFMRNLIVLALNLLIYVLVAVIFQMHLTLNHLLIIPGAVLFFINVGWVAFASAIVSTRFRDIPQLITSLLQVVFFATPIFWTTAQLPTKLAFVDFNPIYHLIEIVRKPLLGGVPDPASWLLTLATAVIGCLLVVLLYRRTYPRLAYWV